MGRGLVLALAALLVLAGCGSPADSGTSVRPDDTATTTTRDTTSLATTTEPARAEPATTRATTATSSDRSVAVRNGTLPTNASLVYERVRTVLGVDTRPPGTVVVGGGDASSRSGGGSVPPFWLTVGVDTAAPVGPVPVGESGYTTGLGTVVVSPGPDANASAVRTVLAHEFVHYVQFAEGRGDQLRGTLPRTTDGQFVTRALLEGVAVDVTDAYLARYHPGDRPNSELYGRIAAAYPAGSAQRYANLQYVAGTDYVDARLDSPAEAASLYERPPRTGEQVLHGLAPSEEPARPLSVTVDGGSFSAVGRDTLGEPFVRTALAGSVDAETATRAATGWGNDTLLTVRDGEAVGYAWALRWDDAVNASEARDALASLPADARLTTVGEETVVVLLGDERFVEETTVRGDEDEIVVETP